MSEWGPWIKHDGSCCPVPAGTFVHVVTKGGEEEFGFIKGTARTHFDWAVVMAHYGNDDWYITRYRIRKPRGLILLQTLLHELDEPVAEVTS